MQKLGFPYICVAVTINSECHLDKNGNYRLPKWWVFNNSDIQLSDQKKTTIPVGLHVESKWLSVQAELAAKKDRLID